MSIVTKTKKKGSTLSDKNKKFWALPKAQRRVAIAKDVIKQLTLQRIKANKGTYVDAVDGVSHKLYNFYETGLGKEKFDMIFKEEADIANKPVCEVCAIGACIVSLANLGDKITVENVFGGSYTIKNILLKNAFNSKVATMMECAFEKNSGYNTGVGCSYEEKERSVQFGKNFSNDKDRLIAIMRNIIRNKGDFRP